MQDSETEKEIPKIEFIKVKCPLCKAEIPSNATKCRHCTGDLNTKDTQADIQEQLRVRVWASKITSYIFLGIFLFFGALILFFILTGNEESGRAGDPEVYQRIEAMTDCAELQEGFDRAEEHVQRNRGVGKNDLAQISIEYMRAYDDRKQEIGCYSN